MVRYEVTGERALALLEAARRADIPHVVESDTESLTFVVRSLADVKAVAAYLGMRVPSGRGRFPIGRLEEHAARMGHKLDRSAYGDVADSAPGTYRVSLMEVAGSRVFPRTATVTTDQVKQFTQGRGRPSKDAVASAAISVHGWGDTYLSDSVQVERFE